MAFTSLDKIRDFLEWGESSEIPRNTVANYCFAFAVTLLFLLFTNLFLASLIFIFGGSMHAAITWISIALTLIFSFFIAKLNFKNYLLWFFIVVISLGLVIMAAIAVSARFYDISYDGQTYQQEGVIQLSEGWNPVYQYLSPGIIGGEQKWINYYPKASWINEGSIYLLTHREQTGKALNLLLILASIALVYTALLDLGILGRLDALLISILAGCNPVSIYQSLSFYIDGQLISLFICIAATFLIMWAGKRRLAAIPFFLAIPIFINLKFTALLDACALIAIFLLATWVHRNERLCLKILAVGSAALVIGGLVIGATSYIPNIFRYGTPFYPLLGPGAIDLKPDNVPGNFIDKNSAEILFLSFFSQSAGVKGVGTTSSYKLPFTYSTTELAAFHYPDPDEGGFGPIFGGIVIVSFLLLLGYYLSARKTSDGSRGKFWVAFWIVVFLIALSVVNPISSLARYVPQAYLIAVVPIILALHSRKNSFRAAGYLAAGLLFFNIGLIANAYVSYNAKTSSAIGAELEVLEAASAAQPLIVHFNEFKSTRIMLDESGIRYTWTNDPHTCLTGFQMVLPENTTEFCLPKATAA